MSNSPPLVDSNIRGAGEPGIDDEDTAKRGGIGEAFPQRGVVMETQAFPEPVHRVLAGRAAVV